MRIVIYWRLYRGPLVRPPHIILCSLEARCVPSDPGLLVGSSHGWNSSATLSVVMFGALGAGPRSHIQGLSYGPLVWDPLILVESVLWAPVLNMVHSWYILESRLGAHTRGP